MHLFTEESRTNVSCQESDPLTRDISLSDTAEGLSYGRGKGQQRRRRPLDASPSWRYDESWRGRTVERGMSRSSKSSDIKSATFEPIAAAVAPGGASGTETATAKRVVSCRRYPYIQSNAACAFMWVSGGHKQYVIITEGRLGG